MKKLSILSLLFLILVASVSAQSKEEKEVTAAVENLRKAMVDADKPALQSLTAEELSYGHSSGTMEDKLAFVEVIASGKSDYKSLELSGQTIKFAGNTAIVRHKFVAEMVNNGASSTISIGVLQIWQKQKGKWKLLARQAFKLL
jgi:ketosteroid isomerase-like protein